MPVAIPLHTYYVHVATVVFIISESLYVTGAKIFSEHVGVARICSLGKTMIVTNQEEIRQW